jgi:hypothetical protein
MASVFIRFRAADYDQWKQRFDDAVVAPGLIIVAAR